MTPSFQAFALVLALFVHVPLQGQSVVGKWKTIDDKTGEARSVIEIFEKDGKIFGRIIKLFPLAGEDPDPVCDACDKDDLRYKKKIIGMEIMKGLKKSGDAYEDGEILDPESGRVYRCRIWVEQGDLKVRGYWGPFYRTQVWKRMP